MPDRTRATLSIIILAVRDLPRMAAFYRAALEGVVIVESATYIELSFGGMRLGLYDRVGFARNLGEQPCALPAGTITPTELYFHVSDVGRCCAQLRALDGREISGPRLREWGETVAYFADPEGNVVAIAAANE